MGKGQQVMGLKSPDLRQKAIVWAEPISIYLLYYLSQLTLYCIYNNIDEMPFIMSDFRQKSIHHPALGKSHVTTSG